MQFKSTVQTCTHLNFLIKISVRFFMLQSTYYYHYYIAGLKQNLQSSYKWHMDYRERESHARHGNMSFRPTSFRPRSLRLRLFVQSHFVYVFSSYGIFVP